MLNRLCVILPMVGLVVWAATVTSPQLHAQELQRQAFEIRETAGLRRFGYPATARLTLPSGALSGPEQARLIGADGRKLTSQRTVMSRHADGSVQNLDVDFVISPGPRETTALQLEYGANVQEASPERGLGFEESAEDFRITAATIRKDARPLVSSMRYTREYLRDAGIRIALREADTVVRLEDLADVRWIVEKRGPLNVRLRCEGAWPAREGHPALPFSITLELVSTKSWIGITHSIPQLSGRQVTLETSAELQMSGQLFWDLDVGYWLYGVLDGDDQCRLRQGDGDWQCRLTSGGRQQVYAAGSPEGAAFRGWGHLQESREDGNVAAFGITSSDDAGPVELYLDGRGNFHVHTASADGDGLTQSVFLHFIPVPLQRTAHTSPASMMFPLLQFNSPANQSVKSPGPAMP